jgi:8-oxo-dGTP pyrophosphatase MutT (NUDIX family)
MGGEELTDIGFWVPGNHSWRGFREVRERGTSRGMERYQTIRAYSAGGVVFRLAPIHTFEDSFEDSFTANYPYMDKECPDLHPTIVMEVVLVGRSHAGTWALPKGTPKPGETIEQVAIRETQEETGLQVQLIAYIGNITYSFVRDQIRYQKQVRHFLLEAIGGDIALHDHEYDLVQWFPLAEACRRLTYHNEVHILYQAEDMLQRWLEHQQSQQL